jgi:1-phosphofructokinase family hexose kinase
MGKIVTVSQNIALDRVVVVRGFQPGQQSRALFGFTQPGGSGVHASLIIQKLGGQTVALGLIGGLTGEMWRRDADARSLRYDMVPIQDDTRLSYCLVDLDQGSVVESVEAGPHVDETALSHLLQLLESHLADADLLVVSGSLPVGLPVDSYAQMIRMAHNYEVPTLADIYGDPLQAAAQQTPWLIKPNLTEFQNLLGRDATSLEEHAEAARRLRGAVAANIALSMGQSGMLLTTPEGQWLLEAPDERMHLPDGPAINTIGCGDALVGALAQHYVESGDLLLGARMGIAAAHANLATYGVPDVDPTLVRQLADQVRVRPLSP